MPRDKEDIFFDLEQAQGGGNRYEESINNRNDSSGDENDDN
jgi:hypothetical protein